MISLYCKQNESEDQLAYTTPQIRLDQFFNVLNSFELANWFCLDFICVNPVSIFTRKIGTKQFNLNFSREQLPQLQL